MLEISTLNEGLNSKSETYAKLIVVEMLKLMLRKLGFCLVVKMGPNLHTFGAPVTKPV